jgi:hypothetical protein
MATIKEAVLNAMAFAREALGLERTENLQLEEIESAQEGMDSVWRITLSMPETQATNPLVALGFRRIYKTFTVMKSTGEVLSMKIRELSS